jgi:hypothetical protein
MKCPSLSLGIQSRGREFSRKCRSIKTIGGFDFEESRLAVEHVDREVRDNVRATAVLSIPGAKTFVVFQEYNSKRAAIVAPPIPNGHRLLLHMSHGGAGFQDGCCRSFELALAAD